MGKVPVHPVGTDGLWFLLPLRDDVSLSYDNEEFAAHARWLHAGLQ
jgi:hypothetical protein